MIAEMKFLVHDAWNWKIQTILIMLPHSNNYRLGKAGGKKKSKNVAIKGLKFGLQNFWNGSCTFLYDM